MIKVWKYAINITSNCPTYYKANPNKLKEHVSHVKTALQKRIILKHAMARIKNMVFEIDSTYTLNEFDVMESDSSSFPNRSDVHHQRTME
jgi:hypothetical protein